MSGEKRNEFIAKAILCGLTGILGVSVPQEPNHVFGVGRVPAEETVVPEDPEVALAAGRFSLMNLALRIVSREPPACLARVSSVRIASSEFMNLLDAACRLPLPRLARDNGLKLEHQVTPLVRRQVATSRYRAPGNGLCCPE